MKTKLTFLLVFASLLPLSVSAAEDCKVKYPNDAYAQCVCECQNKFEATVLKCATEACFGAAAIMRTSCIAGCSKYDASGGDGNVIPFPPREYISID